MSHIELHSSSMLMHPVSQRRATSTRASISTRNTSLNVFTTSRNVMWSCATIFTLPGGKAKFTSSSTPSYFLLSWLGKTVKTVDILQQVAAILLVLIWDMNPSAAASSRPHQAVLCCALAAEWLTLRVLSSSLAFLSRVHNRLSAVGIVSSTTRVMVVLAEVGRALGGVTVPR